MTGGLERVEADAAGSGASVPRMLIRIGIVTAIAVLLGVIGFWAVRYLVADLVSGGGSSQEYCQIFDLSTCFNVTLAEIDEATGLDFPAGTRVTQSGSSIDPFAQTWRLTARISAPQNAPLPQPITGGPVTLDYEGVQHGRQIEIIYETIPAGEPHPDF